MRLYAKGQSFFNARNQKNPFAVKSARLSRANIEFVNLPAYIIPAMLRLLRIFVLTAFTSLFVCVGARAGQINNIRLGAERVAGAYCRRFVAQNRLYGAQFVRRRRHGRFERHAAERRFAFFTQKARLSGGDASSEDWREKHAHHL